MSALRWYYRAFLLGFVLYFKQRITDGFVLFTVVLYPFLYAFLLGLMFRTSNYLSQASTVMIGGAMMSVWGVTVYKGATAIDSERRGQTLDLMVGSPLPVTVNILSRVFANLVISLVSFLLSFAAALLIFEQGVEIHNWIGFLISVILGMVGMSLMGVWFASLAMVNPMALDFMAGVQVVGNILGCFVVPLHFFPSWFHPFSYIFLPYWMTRALQTAASVEDWEPLALSWIAIVLLSLIYFALAIFILRALLKIARSKGRLHVI